MAFICTSIALTLIAADQSASASVADRFGIEASEEEDSDTGLGESLLPPSADDGPLVPSGD